MVAFVLFSVFAVLAFAAAGYLLLRSSQRIGRHGEVSSVHVSIQYNGVVDQARVPARLSVSRERLAVQPHLPFIKPMAFDRADVRRVRVSHIRMLEYLTVEGAEGHWLDDRRLLVDRRAVRILREAGWTVFDPREPKPNPAAASGDG